MQVVVVIVSDQRYAVEAAGVVEVVPLVDVRSMPRAPEWIRGLMDFRGRLIPLLDVRRLLGGEAAAPCRANRILVVRIDDDVLGLLVDAVDSVCRIAPDEPGAHPGLANPDTPYLGRVGRSERGTVQVLRLDRLLAPEHRAVLFERSAGSGS